MKPYNTTELENFILWFSDQEEIPLEARNDFMNHILKVGYLDDKAQKFISESLDYLVWTSKNKADELRQKVDGLSAALRGEKIPEVSLKERIVKDAEKEMMGDAEKFTSFFRAVQSIRTQEAAGAQETEDKAKLTKIKAGL